METKIQKIEKILNDYDKIPYECFSECCSVNSILFEVLELIRNVIKGGDTDAV